MCRRRSGAGSPPLCKTFFLLPDNRFAAVAQDKGSYLHAAFACAASQRDNRKAALILGRLLDPVALPGETAVKLSGSDILPEKIKCGPGKYLLCSGRLPDQRNRDKGGCFQIRAGCLGHAENAGVRGVLQSAEGILRFLRNLQNDMKQRTRKPRVGNFLCLATLIPEGAGLLDAPNSLLGLEYVKACRKRELALRPVAVERIPASRRPAPSAKYSALAAAQNTGSSATRSAPHSSAVSARAYLESRAGVPR